MNYYPNYYSGYPQYGTQFVPQNNNLQNAGVQMQGVQQQVPPLNGKMVDSIDIVKATEVPIGSYGIFPKADLNEIYIKTWNNNGTTNIITFRPVPIENNQIKEEEIFNNKILEKINTIESKLDDILSSTSIDSAIQKSPNRKEIK
jgi:hypothetical protein